MEKAKNPRAIIRDNILKLQGEKNDSDFAAEIGTTVDKLKKWKNASRGIKAEDINQICDRLDKSADWLLGRIEDDRTNPPATDDLGLSRNAIDAIIRLASSEDTKDVFAAFLESSSVFMFFSALHGIKEAKVALERIRESFEDVSDDELNNRINQTFELAEKSGMFPISPEGNVYLSEYIANDWFETIRKEVT